ncbi:MAG: Holliday junction resolvase RuvX [Candidatus Paceibacterota bacterium]
MKYLGIDFGEKRVGIAMSDEEGKIAFPKIVLANDQDLMKNIVDLCMKNGIETVVMGESRNYQGQINEIMWKITGFRKQLETIGLKVVYEPEFMTSVQASQITGENAMIDASAAAIILQSYLDKRT